MSHLLMMLCLQRRMLLPDARWFCLCLLVRFQNIVTEKLTKCLHNHYGWRSYVSLIGGRALRLSCTRIQKHFCYWRVGCLGSTFAIMKKEIKYLPVIGWSVWFAEFLFLERNWAKDEEALKLRFKQLEHKPVPFWVALFVEGTRFTHTKLLAAQEFSISRGMTVPKNVLIPRTKVIYNNIDN